VVKEIDRRLDFFRECGGITTYVFPPFIASIGERERHLPELSDK